MSILITNDDGINAPGIAVLERIARTLSDEVYVVAPETDQSGRAHALTLSDPLRLRKIDDHHYGVSGTPTDCVMMAVHHILSRPPEIVLSGVNIGANLADDVTYSGTVSAAMEGTLLGIRSFALSQDLYEDRGESAVPWDVTEAHAPAILKKLINIPAAPGVLINLNFPACAVDEVKGVRVTRQGHISHSINIEERHDVRGSSYFWLRFKRDGLDGGEGSDAAACYNREVSVTPLQLDLTATYMHETLVTALK